MTALAHRRREAVDALLTEGASEAHDAADLAARCEVGVTIADAAKDLRCAVELGDGPDGFPLARVVHKVLRGRSAAGHADAFVSRLLDPALAGP
jgi:hypothetical protein